MTLYYHKYGYINKTESGKYEEEFRFAERPRIDIYISLYFFEKLFFHNQFEIRL